MLNNSGLLYNGKFYLETSVFIIVIIRITLSFREHVV